MSAPRRPARLSTAQADLYAVCLGLATLGRSPNDVLIEYASGPYAQPAADLLAVRAALDLTARCPAPDCPYPDCQVADPPPGCPAVVDLAAEPTPLDTARAELDTARAELAAYLAGPPRPAGLGADTRAAALDRYRQWQAHPVEVRGCLACGCPWLAHHTAGCVACTRCAAYRPPAAALPDAPGWSTPPAEPIPDGDCPDCECCPRERCDRRHCAGAGCPCTEAYRL